MKVPFSPFYLHAFGRISKCQNFLENGSCFSLFWSSEWEISGLFLVWFPGVACDRSPVHRLDVVRFILPGWQSSPFGQFHKVLGRFCAAPGPHGRRPSLSSLMTMMSKGGRSGDSGGEGWRSSPGSRDKSLPLGERIQALPMNRCCLPYAEHRTSMALVSQPFPCLSASPQLLCVFASLLNERLSHQREPKFPPHSRCCLGALERGE